MIDLKNRTKILIFLLTFIFPVAVFAAGLPGEPPKIENPLKNIGDIPTLITTIVDAITTIGYYIVVIFVIYSGFLFVSARGNKTKLETARTTFVYTVIGAAVLLGASVLSTVIKNTVTEVGGVSSAIVEHIHV